MLKPRLISIIALVLFIFVSINFYIGWNGWLYLSALLPLKNPLPYAFIVAIISISYIIGRFLQPVAPLRKIGRVFKLIGSYWFAVMEYAVLLLPPANLIYWLLTKLDTPSLTALLTVGSISSLSCWPFCCAGAGMPGRRSSALIPLRLPSPRDHAHRCASAWPLTSTSAPSSANATWRGLRMLWSI